MDKITFKGARNNRNLTQREASQKLGLSETTVVRMENNPRKAKFENIVSYCNLLGIEISQLDYMR